MAGLLSDVRGAWRLLGRHRATSLLMLLTLALGIGANAAIFAIGRGVLLRPLPYEDPDRLVMIWGRRRTASPGVAGRGLATPAWFREIRARQQSFTSVAAIELWNGNPSATFNSGSTDGAERLRGAFATPDVFETLGVGAAIGRTFTEADSPDVAVISHDLWQRLFAGSPDAIGRRLELATGRGRERATRSVMVIGALPMRVQFSYPESTDVWLPLEPRQLENPRMQDAIMYRLVARLRPDITLQQAHRDMAAVKASIATALNRDMSFVDFWLEPVHENVVGAVRPAIRLLGGVAALVFVVACLNVATLLLAQIGERRREIAVQLALGASRWRILRQLLTESGLTAIVAAAASVALVAAVQPVLRAAMPPGIPRVEEIGVDLPTLAWVTALVTLATVLSAIAPGWRSAAIDPGPEIASGSRTATASRGATVWRHGLVAVQVAVVVVLVVGGGLLLHSFWKLQHVELGFDGERVFTAEMRLLDPRYFDDARLKAFQSELLSRVRSLPGVQRASITSAVPLRGVDWTRAFTHHGQRLTAKERHVDPEYFAVMGIPLLAGRGFSDADIANVAPVAILSRSLAAQLFPGENPVGQRLVLNQKQQPEIVGLVGDVTERAGRNGRRSGVLPPARTAVVRGHLSSRADGADIRRSGAGGASDCRIDRSDAADLQGHHDRCHRVGIDRRPAFLRDRDRRIRAGHAAARRRRTLRRHGCTASRPEPARSACAPHSAPNRGVWSECSSASPSSQS